MSDERKCPKCPPEGAPEWMLTYGDMVTLLLTFFITMFSVEDTVDPVELRIIQSAFMGVGNLNGGNTLQEGLLAELGNSIDSLPSSTRGRTLDRARKAALSQFQSEVTQGKVRVLEDNRGLVISVASDAFFEEGSAEINMDLARDLLSRIAGILNSPLVGDRPFRIEGHTDNQPTPVDGPFPSNWELSTARATNVLRRLLDYGSDERRFSVAGYADTRPLQGTDFKTPEGRAANRRVDIVILAEGHK